MARKITTKRSTVARRIKVFVDTGGWYAVTSADDRYHIAAVDYYRSFLANGAILITSDYVLDETLTRLRYDFGHSVAIAFWQSIESAKAIGRIQIVSVDVTVWNASLEIFTRYSDQKFSFTDCTSFVLAQREQVDEVFAFDDHFRVFGLNVMPAV